MTAGYKSIVQVEELKQIYLFARILKYVTLRAFRYCTAIKIAYTGNPMGIKYRVFQQHFFPPFCFVNRETIDNIRVELVYNNITHAYTVDLRSTNIPL